VEYAEAIAKNSYVYGVLRNLPRRTHTDQRRRGKIYFWSHVANEFLKEITKGNDTGFHLSARKAEINTENIL